MNTIKIFLASSAELKNDRKEFENFIGRENKTLKGKGIFLHLDIWEDFIDAISKTRLQDEYNKKIQAADIFVMLFFTKVGMYTSEEFDKALEQFKKANKPLIYTYFKNADIKFASLKREEANSVWDFQDKLKKLGHFYTEYENEAELKLHFKEQLDELFGAGLLKIPADNKEITTSRQIPKCLSAGQPSVPPGFVGRDIEIADIRKKLEKLGMLLINAEGGMGKTTLAAKYLNENLDGYKHFAWLFCENGITEQIKILATPLKVDLAQIVNEDDQLLAIKTVMQNLPKDCLLILDNANEPKHIEAFQKKFGGLQWHILLTSRCQQVLPTENEYTLNHLEPEQAKALFKTYHDENTTEFDTLLDKFLTGIGYNTLMIELFSKTLHELSAVGETLAYALEQFREKGLFLGERSFEIRTFYTGNVHREAATTDQVLDVLYDFTKLEETERHILVNLALLPAESHLLTLLIDVLTPVDKITFAKQLKALAQKGWLSTDTKSYRISPVVQQIILAKNKDNLLIDTELLVSNLNKKLEHDGISLINLGTYAQAQPFAELAKSVTEFLKDDTFKTALLSLYLSDYYKAVGNFKPSLEKLNKATEIFQKVDKQNYAVCLERLGSISQQQGDFKKALQFFERYNDLNKELFEDDPYSESLKNGLAISYERLGFIYQRQGDFKKALEFFEQYNVLLKEFFEADPQSELLKNGLAVSYERLGSIYQQHDDLKKALQYFEKYNGLREELFAANPQSESLKNGLATSYERLGTIFRQQGDFKKALQFYDQYKDLTKELFEANPQSIRMYNNLAISYTTVGNLYREMKQTEKTKSYFQQAETIWIHLTKSVPEAVEFQNNLRWVKSQLEIM